MFFNTMKIGTIVNYCGTNHVIVNIVPPTVYIERVSDGARNDVSLTELQNDGEIIYEPGFDVAAMREKYEAEPLTEHEERLVNIKYEMIEPVLDFWKAKENGTLVCFIDEHTQLFPAAYDPEMLTQEEVINAVVRFYRNTKRCMSGRTIHRYLQAYRDFERKGLDGKLGLRAKTGDRVKQRTDNRLLVICKPNRPDCVLDTINVRLSPKHLDILKNRIEKDYLKINGVSVSELIESIEGDCAELEIDTIKDSTVYSILSKLSESVKIKFRGTRQEVLNKVTDKDPGFTHENGRYPLHYIAIDHQKLDVILIDENGDVIGRAWITVGIDLCTRMIWGCYIALNSPSIDRTIKVLKHGLLPKDTKSQYGTTFDYEICGVPQFIMFDNGAELKSEETQMIIRNVLGALVLYRPVRTPHFSGVVERFFRTLNTECIHRLPGTTKSNPAQLGDLNPEDCARLTLPELEKIVMTYITDVYHVSRHKGLKGKNNTPLKQYYKSIRMRGIPQYVSPDEYEQLRFELMRQSERKYTGKGITFLNVRYKSDELVNLIHPSKMYKIKYDNDDISSIMVWHPDEKRYYVVPAVEPSYLTLKGMNRSLFIWLTELMDEKEKKHPDDRAIMTAKAKLRNTIEKSRGKKIAIKVSKAGVSSDKLQPTEEVSSKKETAHDYIKKAMLYGGEMDENVG